MERIRHLRIAGAMGVGKSTVSDALAGKLPGCIVIDADILGTEMVATTQPEPDYERFHDALLRLALDISASGVSVLYHGCALPHQVESSTLAPLFDVRWLALVAEPETRFRRALERGGSAAHYNGWRTIMDALDAGLRQAERSNSQVQLLDTTTMTPEEAIVFAEGWALAALAGELPRRRARGSDSRRR